MLKISIKYGLTQKRFKLMSLYPVCTPKASTFKTLRNFILLTTSLSFLSACATTNGAQHPSQQKPYQQQTQNPIQVPDIIEVVEETKTKNTDSRMTRDGLTPPFMNPQNIQRVALILPFSAKSPRLREEAQSMLQAAELALFARDDDNVLLMALDTEGTSSGARKATNTAVKQGADIILGPILAGSVKSSSDIARKSDTPMIAFSTDTTVAGDGVYLLSFPPEAEVKRAVQYVAQSGAKKFAFLGPNSTYGKRVLSAYKSSVSDVDGIVTGVQTYTGKDITVMQDPASKLAKLYTDTHAKNKAAGNPPNSEAFHVVLLPEGGTALRSLAPLLPFFEENINPSSVQFIGTGLWNRKEVVREPAIRGGIFAGPDMEVKKSFNAKFDAVYGKEPSRLASLAYDAVNIAAFAADGAPKERTGRLVDPSGFFGVDGLVRFDETGAPQRGLAIYQVKNGRFVIIDPAPKTTDGAF